MPPFFMPWIGWYVWWAMLSPCQIKRAEVIDLADWRRANRPA